MKFAAVSDLHLSDKRPKNRKDPNYKDVCFRKFTNILNICENNNIDTLIIGGDIFDYPTIPRYVVTEFLNIINTWDIEILVIPGQHDLRYHAKGLDNTPLGNVIAGGGMKLLHPDSVYKKENIKIVGQGWEEKITIPGDILVTHRMVTYKGPLFPGQTDFISAAALLNKYKNFKCIISGDNHKPHVLTKNGRLQINCGSIMRSNKSQINYKPEVWIIDTNDWKYIKNPIEIDKPEDVFDYNKIAMEETKQNARDEAQEKIDAFVKTFSGKKGEKVKFQTVVKQVIKEVKPSKNVIDIIENILEKIGGNND